MLLTAARDSPGKLVLVLAKEENSVKKKVILATWVWLWVFSSRPHSKRLRLVSSSLQGSAGGESEGNPDDFSHFAVTERDGTLEK